MKLLKLFFFLIIAAAMTFAIFTVVWYCTGHEISAELAVGSIIALGGAVIYILLFAFISTRHRKKSDVGKIYKTTDGYFNGKNIKKPRRVVVVEQRKDDKAVAVAKISKKAGKDDKIGKDFIPDLILKPDAHSSLTEDSIVERQVQISVKKNGTYEPIRTENLTDTKDKLNKAELKKVKDGVQNADPKNRKTYENKIKKWKRHFKE